MHAIWYCSNTMMRKHVNCVSMWVSGFHSLAQFNLDGFQREASPCVPQTLHFELNLREPKIFWGGMPPGPCKQHTLSPKLKILDRTLTRLTFALLHENLRLLIGSMNIMGLYVVSEDIKTCACVHLSCTSGNRRASSEREVPGLAETSHATQSPASLPGCHGNERVPDT